MLKKKLSTFCVLLHSQLWKENLSSTFPSNKAMESTSYHTPTSLTAAPPWRSPIITAFSTVTSQIPALTHWKVAAFPGFVPTLISAPLPQWTAPLARVSFQRPGEGRRWLTVLYCLTRTTRMVRSFTVCPRCLLIIRKRDITWTTPHLCLKGRRGGCRTRSVGKSSWRTGSGAGVNQREHPDRYSTPRHSSLYECHLEALIWDICMCHFVFIDAITGFFHTH